ncbi:MAG: NADP-specific glutamate dehydrogenase [Acidimicrobiales bacterium]|nr:NADP-specific glutamate dehydrogenase [Hyphomonadaceae bacterium]RZV41700.1 MAG: NADP-specific glutamate dehydrogenase [Acidimicrobiales bacterium]
MIKDIELDHFMNGVIRRNPGETEFHQAVQEVAVDIIPHIRHNETVKKMRILERMTEPDRIVSFRVIWEDDKGNIRVNRGYRVQQNNAIGPYKGGIRFHPTVTQSVLKFLAFEQVFKNSLTGLPLGGGKGGSDFNPKGKSDREIMRFCQAFMTELSKYIGPNTDVPAGDIGVGGREVGYMFGQYKRLIDRFEGVLTGKGVEFGGSKIRPEATGYGVVYMMQAMLKQKSQEMAGKVCAVSGSGNVAQYCVEKLLELGAKVVSMSDSGGTIYKETGISKDDLLWIMNLKNVRGGRISEAEAGIGAEYLEGKRPWQIECELAFPCATQNEIEADDAKSLIKKGCKAISEGANMPSTPAAIEIFREGKIVHAPSKAANAGGVAVSGLEMSQNSLRMSWSREDVDNHLRNIMADIHDQCVANGTNSNGDVDYFKGANIAGFEKVSRAMLAYGAI